MRTKVKSLSLIREYVNSVLGEKAAVKRPVPGSPRVGRGSAIQQEKLKRKEAYEAAIELMNDYNAALKQYQAKQKDRNAPEPEWPTQPDGKKSGAQSGDKIAKFFEKAKSAYRELSPTLETDLAPPEPIKYTPTTREKTEEDAVLPGDEDVAIWDIDQTPVKTWYAWPAEVLESGIPYGSARKGVEGGAEAGVGPAEGWLAFLFGGKKQGGGVSYDVVTKGTSGMKMWEVKEVIAQSTLIRPGTHGMKVLAEPYEVLKTVLAQLQEFGRTAQSLNLLDPAAEDLDDFDKRAITYITDFITAEKAMIAEKGEISNERINALYTVLEVAKKFLDKAKAKGDKPGKKMATDVSLNKKKFSVDKNTFIDVARRVEKATGEKPPVDDVSILISTLQHPAFNSPEEFLDTFFNSVEPLSIFGHTSGVFIVNPEGFIIIPREELNNSMEFEVISQGKPKFRLSSDLGWVSSAAPPPKFKKTKKAAPARTATTTRAPAPKRR